MVDYSYYEINITLNGKHFFATAPRSATTVAMYNKLLGVLYKKFPKSEGYAFTALWYAAPENPDFVSILVPELEPENA